MRKSILFVEWKKKTLLFFNFQRVAYTSKMLRKICFRCRMRGHDGSMQICKWCVIVCVQICSNIFLRQRFMFSAAFSFSISSLVALSRCGRFIFFSRSVFNDFFERNFFCIRFEGYFENIWKALPSVAHFELTFLIERNSRFAKSATPCGATHTDMCVTYFTFNKSMWN